jgi:hypothetical protein
MSLTGLAFAVAFLMGIAACLIRHPRYGLYTYLAVFYLDPPHRWWGSTLPDLRWSLLAAVVTLLGTLRLPPDRNQPTWTATTPVRLLIAFTVWIWIQNLWALAPPEHLEASILFTKYLVLFYLMYRICNSVDEIGRVLMLHVAGCAYLGILVILASEGGRLEGVGGPGIDEANALGMFLATGIITGAVVMLAGGWLVKALTIVCMPLMLNGLVQTVSRGATLALMVGGLTLFFLRPPGYRRQFIFFGILGLLLVAIVAKDFYWERISTISSAVTQSEDVDSSAESRIVIIEAQLRMAAAYPFGTGHRGTAVLSPKYIAAKWLTVSQSDPNGVAARSSHNSFMSALVEQGLFGAVLFLGIAFWSIKSVFRLRGFVARATDKRSRAGLYAGGAAAAMMSVLVAGLFTDYIKTEVQIWMLAILTVLLYSVIPTVNQQSHDPARPVVNSSAARYPGARFHNKKFVGQP